ncbi:hypothetical protein [Paenibacillus glucanolyticus]|uniref:hypothetical protein n=1 Tax=Paenibacillus glucanolyticus TaxID=59843 RepID=UPI00117BFFC2|nr:hypothetical protein [Paenibacillus glucanolyticus]
MLDHAKSAAIGTGRAVRSSAGMMSGAARSTAGLTRQVAALGAAYLTARGAKSLFDKTIGAASQYEMREVTVTAMFGKDSQKNARQYLDFVQSRADISMFTMNDFLDAGKSFIPTTKDNKQLERMINLAERLGAIDPEQGLTGGAYALREFFSGDAVSLVERFELPRAVVSDWKNLPLEEQLKNLDKYFDKIGATNELLNAQSRTSLGQYRKSIGQINRAFREMGTEGLRKINPLLEDFNKYLSGEKFKKVKAWATDAFRGITEGAVNMVRKATDYISTNFIDNPEFQRLPDIQAKIKYIFNTLWDDFTAWYNAEGRAKVQAIATDLTNTLGAALSASPQLLGAAAKLGVDIGAGIIKGVLSDPLLATLLGGGAAAKLFGGGGGKGGGGKGGKVAALAINPYVVGGGAALAAMGYSSSVWESVKSNPDSIYSSKVIGGGSNAPVVPNTTKITDSQVNALVGHLKGHNGGLRNVPYNGYTASLHSGEAVLTREEAKRYRGESGANGGGKAVPIVNITGPIHINNGMDYDEFVGRLVRDLAQ